MYIKQMLVYGSDTVEEDNIAYTCWMGMISSNIKVVADVTRVSSSDIAESNNSSAAAGGIGGTGGCCGATPPQ